MAVPGVVLDTRPEGIRNGTTGGGQDLPGKSEFDRVLPRNPVFAGGSFSTSKASMDRTHSGYAVHSPGYGRPFNGDVRDIRGGTNGVPR